MAQDKSARNQIQAVKIPDISKMTDEEIDAYARDLWEKFAAKK